ncbi:hypothetical protein SK128_003698 [Halocaridina rubra]|uniref:Uncharacterized protein n=1 Tax=Halocaridina rubra TaxID=373956 RepID=A0AAN8WEA3_HALRR
MVNQVDVLLSQLGTGKWNFLHFIVTGLATGMPAPHALSGAFVVPRIDHSCRQADIEYGNYHSSDYKNDSCTYLDQSDGEDLQEEKLCTEWDYDNSTFTTTITSEFDLVCQKEYIRALYSSLYMIGVLVGSPFIGYLSDK